MRIMMGLPSFITDLLPDDSFPYLWWRTGRCYVWGIIRAEKYNQLKENNLQPKKSTVQLKVATAEKTFVVIGVVSVFLVKNRTHRKHQMSLAASKSCVKHTETYDGSDGNVWCLIQDSENKTSWQWSHKRGRKLRNKLQEYISYYVSLKFL